MSYTYYCFGLAAQGVDSDLTEDEAAAYAIGSMPFGKAAKGE